MSYADALAHELDAVGIRGRRRKRILAEIEDHLRCDPDAELGTPRTLARQFADELGTVLARRAVLVAFASLALAALFVGVAFLAAQHRLFASASNASPTVGAIGAWLAVIGGQVALVAGGSAALRTVRHRGAGVVSRAEAVTFVRRAAVGLGAGAVTMVGFGLTAIALLHHVGDSWTTLALVLSGAGIVVVLAAGPAVIAATRLRPATAGEPGDMFDDLGPIVPPGLRGHPWRFALVTATVVAAVIAAAGVIQSDPFDGLLRGFADGVACLIGFAALGRYLRLRA